MGREAPQAALSPDAKQHGPKDKRNSIARQRFIRVDGNNPQGQGINADTTPKASQNDDMMDDGPFMMDH